MWITSKGNHEAVGASQNAGILVVLVYLVMQIGLKNIGQSCGNLWEVQSGAVVHYTMTVHEGVWPWHNPVGPMNFVIWEHKSDF